MLELCGICLLRVAFTVIVGVTWPAVHPNYDLRPPAQISEAVLPSSGEDTRLTRESGYVPRPPEGYRQLWQRLAATMGPPGLMLGLFSLALHFKERRRFHRRLSRVSKDVATAGASERIRIARELHDGVCQWLVVSKRSFERAFGSANTSDPGYTQHLRTGLSNLEECIREIRRISHDLKPQGLPADQPFSEALSKLVHEFAECTQLNLQVDGLDAGKGEKLSAHAQLALYRTAQEALTNIEKHAKASQITLALQEEEMLGQVTLAILDNGCGARHARASGGCHAGIGVSNMRERVAEVGGVLTLRSSDHGTEVIAKVPTTDPTPPLRFLQDEAPA